MKESTWAKTSMSREGYMVKWSSFREDDGGSDSVGVETLIDVLAGHNDFGELHRVPARFPLYLFPVLETVCVVIERKASKQAP